ncbi:MAG: DNA-formamidopyrimidine glycosylase family protein [Chloroflexota bacterium]
MPELPDLAILADALHAGLVGRPVVGADVVQPLVMRATTRELAALEGQALRSVRRRGKFLVFEFDRDRIVNNPMLTGRLGMALPGAKAFQGTAFVLTFGPRAGRPEDAAPWTAAAAGIPADDSRTEMRYRDPTRMGKVYLVPAGVDRAIAGWEGMGPDADDPALGLDTWRQRIRRHRGELKNLLKEQTFVAGVGNGYADEILWEARLAPLRTRSSLAADEVDTLYHAMRSVLPWAVEELRQRVPPRYEVEVRDFLRVHRKGGTPCPRCGTTISEISPGGFVTSWCRTCQR